MRKTLRTSIPALALAGFSLALAGTSAAQTYGPVTPEQQYAREDQWQRTYRDFTRGHQGERLRGRRYQEIRYMARSLAEHAREAARLAAVSGYRGGASERRLLPSVNDFARRANQLDARMERYFDAPFDVRGELVALSQIAEQVDYRIHVSRFHRRAVEEWRQTLETLRSMERTLASYDSRQPPRYRY